MKAFAKWSGKCECNYGSEKLDIDTSLTSNLEIALFYFYWDFSPVWLSLAQSRKEQIWEQHKTCRIAVDMLTVVPSCNQERAK